MLFRKAKVAPNAENSASISSRTSEASPNDAGAFDIVKANDSKISPQSQGENLAENLSEKAPNLARNADEVAGNVAENAAARNSDLSENVAENAAARESTQETTQTPNLSENVAENLGENLGKTAQNIKQAIQTPTPANTQKALKFFKDNTILFREGSTWRDITDFTNENDPFSHLKILLSNRLEYGEADRPLRILFYENDESFNKLSSHYLNRFDFAMQKSGIKGNKKATEKEIVDLYFEIFGDKDLAYYRAVGKKISLGEAMDKAFNPNNWTQPEFITKGEAAINKFFETLPPIKETKNDIKVYNKIKNDYYELYKAALDGGHYSENDLKKFLIEIQKNENEVSTRREKLAEIYQTKPFLQTYKIL